MKRLLVGLLLVITLGMGVASAQIVDVYNKLGSDVVIKPAVKGAEPFFSGIYDEARVWVTFEDFWVEGRVGMNFTTNNKKTPRLQQSLEALPTVSGRLPQ